ncbi:hypothetical protein, partial [uncultured Imperialibacter sp.]|uniref:hypothetical protein n=1 Tax=uncultured Imperialibacter sp. TaxID=1672639 RepID=UPI0030D88156
GGRGRAITSRRPAHKNPISGSNNGSVPPAKGRAGTQGGIVNRSTITTRVVTSQSGSWRREVS